MTLHRRKLLKDFLTYIGAGTLMHLMGRSYAFADDLMVIDMSEKKRKDPANKECVAVGKGLNYVDNLGQALKKKTLTKSDLTVNGKTWKPGEQSCDNCMFYNYKKENPPKPTCQLIPKCLVHPKGSCTSWTPKA